METATRLAKRIVAYPENSVPYISTREYVGRYAQDPRRPVCFPSSFRILSWIGRYNLGWATGDLIAGLTVGLVLVPQGMSYATIATLPPQYGLYSSFVGVTVYCLFATSKDVSIGPVAVVSLIMSQIIGRVGGAHPGQWGAPEIATTVAFISGLSSSALFIPAVAVSGFMTGSAISIAASQVPGLMGITGFNTRAATYQVIINTLKGLPKTTLDAAWGLPSLVALYAIRMLCDYLGKRYPRRARVFFFISVIRNAFVILVMTIAAWLYCRHRRTAKGGYPIKILQTVPRGFQHVGQPTIDPSLLSALAGELPVATIVLLLEHIAISKSFGRLNGYTINPNQELIAIGVTNTVGSCFGAYPATGSFSRSALKSKSGVRTPLAGLVTAIVVLVALYGLTPAFFWIPNAALSAVIIHAVADLVASPAQVYSYWRVSPLEFVFSSVENGIYVSICTSVGLLLIRIAHPRANRSRDVTVSRTRTIKIDPPSPGVIVYRHEESAIFPNASHLNAELVSHRPWNDPGPSHHGADADQLANEKLPDLKAIVLDLSAISHLDVTAVQALMDTRNEVERWADHPVEFHFATLLSPWIRRALVAGGFGTGTPSSQVPREIAQVVPYRELQSGSTPEVYRLEGESDVEAGDKISKVPHSPDPSSPEGFAPVVEEDTPFFHLDLAAAVRAAEGRL
ncbi:sulfate transporter family-domain-containing protein [Mycena olivaceomarginata]|nr:sulfate transporter family-domain-containing protein [Mycena olivaceomarginata]